MVQRLLNHTRGLSRLAIAGVAVLAVLLAASLPKAAWAHEGRAEEVLTEATEDFDLFRTPYDGPGGDLHDLVATLPGAVALPHVAAAVDARHSAAVGRAPRAPFSAAVASRAPPARR